MKISDVTEATGLSQSQIAHKLGLHRSAVTRWIERGIPSYREAQMRELIASNPRRKRDDKTSAAE